MESRLAPPALAHGLAFGFAYGLLLALFGLWAASIDAGCFLPLGLAAAPLSGLGPIAALWSSPLLWAALGWMSMMPAGSRGRWLSLALLIAHYMSLPLVILSHTYARPGSWGQAWHSHPVLLGSAISIYLLGQSALLFQHGKGPLRQLWTI